MGFRRQERQNGERVSASSAPLQRGMEGGKDHSKLPGWNPEFAEVNLQNEIEFRKNKS